MYTIRNYEDSLSLSERYFRAKSLTNCDVHLAEILFQTRSKLMIQLLYGENPKEENRVHKYCSNRKSGKKIWEPGGT